MKKIVKRRKSFRINNPLAFGILCAMVLVLIGGSIYALAAGLAVPAVQKYQAANATPTPPSTPDPADLTTPTPGLATATPTPAEGAEDNDPATGTEAEPLAEYVIGIDAARGYSSKIKGSFSGVYANRLNYTIATLVKERLEALGAEVVIPLAKVTDDMETPKRVEILNDAKVNLAVRIECNFVDTADTRGCIMWTCGEHKQVKECDKLARAILTAYTKSTEMPVQEYNGESIRHKNDESFLSGIDAPTCALIMGYISNRSDDTNLNNEDFQKKVADSIVSGILAYLGIEE